jgi:hypothetical protein
MDCRCVAIEAGNDSELGRGKALWPHCHPAC